MSALDESEFQRLTKLYEALRLREEVLTGLGWAILRIWSTDWFEDSERETEKLVQRLEELRSSKPQIFGDYVLENGSAKTETISDIESTLERGVATAGSTDRAAFEDGRAVSAEAAPFEAGNRNLVFLLNSSEPLTELEGFKALEAFRDTVIKQAMGDWEPHRSILRDSMIETFIRQEITDPEDWFRKVPQFQRSGTNPVEKNAYLQNICDIVSRVDRGLVRNEARLSHSSAPLNRDLFAQAANASNAVATEASVAPQGQPDIAPIYKAADLTMLNIRLDPESFYEPGYRAKIRLMVSLVIETEAPIYDDLLVQRVARAHGFQRSGPTIQALVLGAVEKRFQKTREDGRQVFWRLDSDPTVPCPFRSGDVSVRSHADVPISELASIAIPFVRLRMPDEPILRKMVERLDLGRLREVTRKRLLEAITFARESLVRNAHP